MNVYESLAKVVHLPFTMTAHCRTFTAALDALYAADAPKWGWDGRIQGDRGGCWHSNELGARYKAAYLFLHAGCAEELLKDTLQAIWGPWYPLLFDGTMEPFDLDET